ncbi:MAG: DEAD/DEAH box helicase family protein [Leptospira sp.]|nr:DEAD/DEAH box helicase family protein [Leptospira sp.]
MDSNFTKTERDVITKKIIPAILNAGWDLETQVQEEVYFTAGRIFVRGQKTARGHRKRADIVLYYKPNIPVAIIEVKDKKHSVGSGMQQVLDYGSILDVPVVFSTNGYGFLEHDRTGLSKQVERNLSLENFPSPEELWEKYKLYKKIGSTEEERIASFDYFPDGSNKSPRYYQQIAINRSVEAIAKGQDRILLVMATGTGKTYTAFQIIYRLWKSGTKKRILFLADRNALISQTMRGDFRHFKDKMTVIRKRVIDKAFEIYLALYQGITGNEEDADAYKEFSPDFFDLIVVDECHRGSAAEESNWRRVLEYFSSATQIGLTATPKETSTVSNIEYFGDPIYTYSLRQGIDDGFLAPYKVVRIGINIDLEGWRPDLQTKDSDGNPVEDRTYNLKDFDKNLVIDERTKTVASKIAQFLRKTNVYDKTIVFCIDIEHAERMRQALCNEFPEEVTANSKYVMRITGDDMEGKRELENFINPEETYPVIATTSKLMTTGVDTQTVKLIVLESNIRSMTEFKQIIGRGTRIQEEHGKEYFTIMDFRNATDLFADPEFDGDPIQIKTTPADSDLPDELFSGDDTSGSDIIDPATGLNVEFDLSEEADVSTKPRLLGVNSASTSLLKAKSPKRDKVYVRGVNVGILNERVQFLDEKGRLITISLKEFTKNGLIKRFRSLENFLKEWMASERKEILVRNLEEQGILLEELREDVKKDLDIFDLICHVAFGRPPLSRRERADNVKKRDYFSRYEDKAGMVLEALLEKYAIDGIENVEEMSVLKVDPFTEYGTPTEIVNLFGGKENFQQAIRDLEREIYNTAA